jgi:hypothetical protein
MGQLNAQPAILAPLLLARFGLKTGWQRTCQGYDPIRHVDRNDTFHSAIYSKPLFVCQI